MEVSAAPRGDDRGRSRRGPAALPRRRRGPDAQLRGGGRARGGARARPALPGRIWQAATSVLGREPSCRADGRPEPPGAPAGSASCGAVPTSAPRPSRWPSTSSGCWRATRSHPARVAVLVPEITHEGQAVSVALEERAIPHRLVGEAAFFQRAEIRDVLAWLRLLADPTDAGAVVRALARPPIELRSVDIARCTQIARRRKLDMVSALARRSRRRRSRRRPASASACSSSSTRPARARSTRAAPTSTSTG